MAKKQEFDIHGKTSDELKDTLLDLKKQQFNLRFQRSQGGLANTASLRHVRRNIARTLTAMSPIGPKVKKANIEGDAMVGKKPAAKKATKKSAT